MKGAAPPPGHVPPPNDWPCLYPGCDRRDLPTGHTSCERHREPFFKQQTLPLIGASPGKRGRKTAPGEETEDQRCAREVRNEMRRKRDRL